MDTSKHFHFDDVACPVCGNHDFMYGRVPPDEDPKGTIYWCLTGRENHSTNYCTGVLAYCKKCEKLYPSTNFGYHAGAYECKECGSVQWEYTDYMKFEEKAKQILSQIGLGRRW